MRRSLSANAMRSRATRTGASGRLPMRCCVLALGLLVKATSLARCRLRTRACFVPYWYQARQVHRKNLVTLTCGLLKSDRSALAAAYPTAALCRHGGGSHLQVHCQWPIAVAGVAGGSDFSRFRDRSLRRQAGLASCRVARWHARFLNHPRGGSPARPAGATCQTAKAHRKVRR